MTRLLRLSFFIGLVVLPLFAQSQVRGELEQTDILIGDQVDLHIRIYNAVDVSEPKADLAPLRKTEGIELLNSSEWDTIHLKGNIIYEQNLTLTVFDSGYYFIPSIIVNYKKGGRSQSQTTNELPLKVSTIETNPEEVAPIKDIIEEPWRIEDLLPWFLGLLVLILAILGFYFYQKKKKKEELPPPPEIILPAHEIALNQLKALTNAKLWQQGEIKEYQSQLTHIVREYLENRYDIQALESTTDQILRDMKQQGIPSEHRDKLQEMFLMADLVKFAKAKPPVDVNETLMEYSEDFVRKTKKIVVLVEEDKEEEKEAD